MLISVGDKKYSLPVTEIERVIHLHVSSLSPVPFDQSGRIIGIFNNAGTATVLLRWGGYAFELDGRDEMTAVILKDEKRRFAVLVDAVSTVSSDTATPDILPLSVKALLGEFL